MLIAVEILRAWMTGLLEAAGLSEKDAADAADIFIRASERGVGHHDVSFLPLRLEWLHSHGVNPRPVIVPIIQGGAVEVWDGNQGLGELVCRRITERALELAQKQGIAYVSARNSNHFLAASPYAELGAEAGYFVMLWSNTDAGMSSPGGVRNIIGNNPMGFGVGVRDHAPLLLDICMAYSSLGNLKALAAESKEIPVYWGFDKDGQPSTKPKELLEGGAVRPMADHKGFGLALMNECLTGILAGGHTIDTISPGGGVNTHNQAVIAIDLKFLGGADLIKDRMADMVGRIKTLQPGLRLPGERSWANRDRSLREGLRLSDNLAGQLKMWSERLKVEIPKGL